MAEINHFFFNLLFYKFKKKSLNCLYTREFGVEMMAHDNDEGLGVGDDMYHESNMNFN